MHTIILREGQTLIDYDGNDFTTDAVWLHGQGAGVDKIRFEDPVSNTLAHRDFIQVVPASAYGRFNQQYALAKAKDNFVLRSEFRSCGQCQGVFGSDGLFQNIIIWNNHIVTQSQHYITLCGLLSGSIYDNTTEKIIYGIINKVDCPVFLDNARVGGGVNGGLYILSFEDLEYQAINGLENYSSLRDMRGIKHRLHAKHLKNFKWLEYRKTIDGLPYQQPSQLQKIAMDFGTEA